jgi:myo-inositol-1(or 4)-monophosphatase
MWGVSLGLLRDGLPYLGAVYLPLLDDCYWVGPNGGAYRNDQPIHVSSPQSWESESWLAVTSNTHRRFAIDFAGKTRSLGCTAASFCYVARGSALGALVTRSAIWDIAAGMALLRAAGGVAVSLSGVPLDTRAMVAGQLLAEPVLLSAEAQSAALRAAIIDRQAPPGNAA